MSTIVLTSQTPATTTRTATTSMMRLVRRRSSSLLRGSSGGSGLLMRRRFRSDAYRGRHGEECMHRMPEQLAVGPEHQRMRQPGQDDELAIPAGQLIVECEYVVHRR